MTFSRITRWLTWLPGVLSLGLIGMPAHGQFPPAQPRRADIRKEKIELPTKQLLAAAAAVRAGNPAVPPGKVRWHPTFAAACQAAQQSGKPVLLFQMLGRLDQQFC
jgi:hypothetical protein